MVSRGGVNRFAYGTDTGIFSPQSGSGTKALLSGEPKSIKSMVPEGQASWPIDPKRELWLHDPGSNQGLID
jgi:hypothetical protein